MGPASPCSCSPWCSATWSTSATATSPAPRSGAGAVAFGAIGAIVTVNGLPIVWAYVASAVFAALVVLGVQQLVKRLRDTEDGTAYSLVGVSGVVTSTVVPNGAGEVSLDDPRELERRLAWADVEIPAGARIVVLEQAGSRVKVTPA